MTGAVGSAAGSGPARGGRRGFYVGVAVVLVVLSGVGVAESVRGPVGGRPVVVTDALGVRLTYSGAVAHDLGGPVCANCPTEAAPGARIVVTLWVDWVCPAPGPCGVTVEAFHGGGGFGYVGSGPALPFTLVATVPSTTPPGNGTWVSATEVIALYLTAPSSGGPTSLSGTVLLGPGPP